MDPVVLPDGKIVAAGYASNAVPPVDVPFWPRPPWEPHTFAMVRLNPNGTLDTADDVTPATSFGPGGSGTVMSDVTPRVPVSGYPTTQNKLYDVLLLPDGELIAARTTQPFEDYGFTYDFYSNPDLVPADYVLARYTADGMLDANFGAAVNGYDANGSPRAGRPAESRPRTGGTC